MVSDAVRSELAKLCKKRKTRKSSFSRTLPTHWAPQHVIDPSTNAAFTPDSAWEFVAEKIDAGHEIDVIELKIPAGKKGFVMIVDGSQSEKIYIKLQMGSGVVLGRSFHISKDKGELS